jgi:hypothetical protein
MKLQNLSNLSLQQQELNNVKGGKRVSCHLTLKMQELLASAVKISSTGNTTPTSHSTLNRNIMIEWKSKPCKKP